MARIVYSRKLLFLVLLVIYVIATYIVKDYGFETVVYGTVALVIVLSYIAYFATRPYLSRSDSIAAITLSIVAVLLGYLTGLLLQPEKYLAASLYVLSATIVYVSMVYALARYLA